VEEGFTPKLEQTGMAGFGKVVQSPFFFIWGRPLRTFFGPL
jgi:hypothetical protein